MPDDDDPRQAPARTADAIVAAARDIRDWYVEHPERFGGRPAAFAALRTLTVWKVHDRQVAATVADPHARYAYLAATVLDLVWTSDEILDTAMIDSVSDVHITFTW